MAVQTMIEPPPASLHTPLPPPPPKKKKRKKEKKKEKPKKLNKTTTTHISITLAIRALIGPAIL